ncbi:MAG: hypothetical protein EB084_24675 [Proteobacteria bacterium]|nr:hypothetical protein [Pseudomonadota bacterium]
MSRDRARSTLITITVALVIDLLGGWLLAQSTLIDRMIGHPDAWAVLPVLFMALRLFVLVGAPPLVAIALVSLMMNGREKREEQA